MPPPAPPTSELPPLRVALCQIETAPGDFDGNVRRTRLALLDAARQGAQLAITPECVLQGYPDMATDAQRAHLRSIAQPVDGESIASMRSLAAEHHMAVALGFAERGQGDFIHNTCLLIGADGAILTHYRKVHCRTFESAEHTGLYTPGAAFEVAALTPSPPAYRIGTYICFDREVPESTRCMRALGAEFIVCPLATNTSRLDAAPERVDNEMITRVRAAENEVFIAVVNHAGTFNGGSFVVGPSGECLVQLGAAPEVRCIDLDLGIVRRRFHNDPWGWAGWGSRRDDVYARALGSRAR